MKLKQIVSQMTDLVELLEVHEATRARISEIKNSLPVIWDDDDLGDSGNLAIRAYNAGEPVLMGGDIHVKGPTENSSDRIIAWPPK